MLFIGLFYIFLPSFLIAVLVFNREPDKFNWLLSVLVKGLAVLFIWTIARWELVGIYLRPIFPILFLVACFISYKRVRKPDPAPKKIVVRFNIGLNLVLVVFLGIFCWLALKGHRVPDNTIELASPLRDGKFVVLHGGSGKWVNGHFFVRPQNYAIDVVGLNGFGMRAPSIAGGANLNDYVIFGESVYSPVNGKVILVVDGFDDLIPPKADTDNLAGNHVLIESEGNEILLAHLKKDSITVKAGDSVNTNTILGQVGNTGYTSEPHLHMHVEQGGEPNMILNGKAVPFKIGGQFLIRGDVF